MSVFDTTRLEINGSLDTSKTVLSNVDLIAKNSQTFIAWDPSKGKWTFTINKAESLSGAREFDDTNIVGSINVTGSGIDSIYNAVRTEFAHVSLEGQTDQYYAEISESLRYDNESDNQLSMKLELINNPAQAAFLSNLEMKQSRLDKVITFSTDYSQSDVQAGELILVTNSVYGYSQKPFRVTEATEGETEDGTIIISIVALEYDSDVYDESGLEWPERNKITNIVPIQGNVCVQTNIIETLQDRVTTDTGGGDDPFDLISELFDLVNQLIEAIGGEETPVSCGDAIGLGPSPTKTTEPNADYKECEGEAGDFSAGGTNDKPTGQVKAPAFVI